MCIRDSSSGQPDFPSECILWATGQVKPNNDFIPTGMLTKDGFVNVDAHLRVTGFDNIFAIGDIAATDPNRSSARNEGYKLAAHNIDKYLSGQESRMKNFKAPKFRWGSILGIQNEGLRIFTPQGLGIRVGPWSVKNILFPIFVDRMIYRGMTR